MNGTGGHHVKSSKSSSGKQKPHVFSHMQKTDPKDKRIPKTKQGHILIYM
jgi:hypothetical protein